MAAIPVAEQGGRWTRVVSSRRHLWSATLLKFRHARGALESPDDGSRGARPGPGARTSRGAWTHGRRGGAARVVRSRPWHASRKQPRGRPRAPRRRCAHPPSRCQITELWPPRSHLATSGATTERLHRGPRPRRSVSDVTESILPRIASEPATERRCSGRRFARRLSTRGTHALSYGPAA